MNNSEDDKLVIDLECDDEAFISSDQNEELIPFLESSNDPVSPQVTSDSSIQCHLCQMGLNPQGVHYHMRIHHQQHQNKPSNEDPVNSIQCHFCEILLAPEDFEGHLQIFHTSKEVSKKILRPFPCSLCHHRSPSLEALHQHQMSHEDKVKCDFCRRKVQQKNLKKHQEIFHPLNPEHLQCQKCSKVFISRELFERHQRRVHRERFEGSDEDFKCQICEEVVPIKKALEHYEKLHKKNEKKVHKKCVKVERKSSTFICLNCGFVTGVRRRFEEHKKSHM